MKQFIRHQGRDDRQLKMMARADQLKADLGKSEMMMRDQSIPRSRVTSGDSRFFSRLRSPRAPAEQEWFDRSGLI
jgi:hypothetical protein